MAIELEKIQPWDGQSGTGADARGVIDRNFEKIETELETTSENLVQLAGDLSEILENGEALEPIAKKVIGTNLFDKSKAREGFAIVNNKIESRNNLKVISGYIPVVEGSYYTRQGPLGTIGVKNKGDIQGTLFSGQTFMIPLGSGIKYIVAHITNTQGIVAADTFRINKGEILLPYEPYSEKWELREESLINYITKEGVEHNINHLRDEILVEETSKNLFDMGAVQIDKRMGSSNGNIYNAVSYVLSDYIPVVEGNDYVKSGDGTSYYAYFKNIGDTYPVNMSLLDASSNGGVFTVPTGIDANYVVFQITSNKDNLPNFTIQIEKGNTPTEYEEYVPPTDKIRKELLPKNEGNTNDIIPVDTLEMSLRELSKRKIEQLNNSKNLINLNKTLGNVVADSIERTVNIANPYGEVVEDALAILYLHHGNNMIEEDAKHIFLEGKSRKDFTDVRFSKDGKPLHSLIVSSGNYEIIPDGRIKGDIFCFDGDLIYGSRDGIYFSSDNLETYSTIIEGYVEPIGLNSLGDLFFTKGPLREGKIYKRTRASNYEDESVSLDVGIETSFHRSSFNITNSGALLAGCYQDEFNIGIWRSSDDGITWSRVMDNTDRQHIHSIVVDRKNGDIYANIDGYISGNTDNVMALFKSTDDGLSWSQVANPFPTDYGVIFSNGEYSYGGGEGAVKASPTAYLRNNSTNEIEIGLDIFANSPKAYGIDDKVIIVAGGHSSHNQSELYITESGYNDFKKLYTSRAIDTRVMNRAYRYGTKEEPITPFGDEPQHIFTHNYAGEPDLKSLRFYNGGDHWSALVYVHIPLLPPGGLDIQLTTGNAGLVDSTEVFSRENPLFELKLNEGTDYVFDNKGKEYNVANSIKDFKEGVRYGFNTPVSNEYLSEGSYRTFIVDIDEIDVKGKTLSFWIKKDSLLSPAYIAVGNNLEIYATNNLEIKTNGIIYPTTFYSLPNNSRRVFIHICIVFGAKTQVYVNGYLNSDLDLTIDGTITKIMSSSSVDEAENGLSTTGVRIFDKEMSATEVLREFHGGVYV